MHLRLRGTVRPRTVVRNLRRPLRRRRNREQPALLITLRVVQWLVRVTRLRLCSCWCKRHTSKVVRWL